MDSFHSDVAQVYIHPKHLPVRMLHDYDFALLKLSNIPPSNFAPLCLPAVSDPSLCKVMQFLGNYTVAASELQRVADMDCNSKRNYAGLVSGSMECWRSSLVLCDVSNLLYVD